MAVGQKQVEPAGWYISLFGSASWLDDVKTDYNYGDDFSNEVDTDVGFIVGGAVGTHLTDDVRVELEVAYSENDVDSISWSGSSETYDATGDFSFLTFMGNVWYDVPLSEDLKPYVGGGAGIAIVGANDVGFAGIPFPHTTVQRSPSRFKQALVSDGLFWII